MKRITMALKKKLRKPLGRLFGPRQMRLLKRAIENRYVIAVGDATIQKLAAIGISAHINVYDLKTKREPLPPKQEAFFGSLHAEKLVCINPAGYITQSLERAVVSCLKTPGPTKLFVIGEEDLAALVFLMQAHHGVIVYGQPGKGIVLIEITPNSRRLAEKFYRQFRDVK